MELRIAGLTYQQIADELGYTTPGAAKKAADKAIQRQELDLAKEVVRLDLQRLDDYQQRCTAVLRTKNDLTQIDRLLRIQDQRYRLLGVAPSDIQALREERGMGTQINMGGVQIIQVGHNDEQGFVRSMMQAAGVDIESDEAKEYLSRVETERTVTAQEETTMPVVHALPAGSTEKEETKKKKIVVRRTVKGCQKKRRVVIHVGEKEETTPHPPPHHQVVKAPGRTVSASTTENMWSTGYHPLVEEEVVDAEVIEDDYDKEARENAVIRGRVRALTMRNDS
jgi:hypothetical protein